MIDIIAILEICLVCNVCTESLFIDPLSGAPSMDTRTRGRVSGDDAHPHPYYDIYSPLVTKLFGDDPRVYTFIGNSTDNISERKFPEIGNGHVATQIGNELMFMAGLYNGFKTKSHRAAIPSTIGWHLYSPSYPNAVWEYILDTARGVFVHRTSLNGVAVEMRSFVMRDIPSIIVREIHAIGLQENLNLSIQGLPKFESDDLSLSVTYLAETVRIKGLTTEKETSDSLCTPVFIVFDNISSSIVLSKDTPSVYFITSVHQNDKTAWMEYTECRGRASELYQSHVEKWLTLWEDGRLSIGGDLELAQVTQAAQYYLLTSLPWPDWKFSQSWPFFGLSPGGLAHGNTEEDYLGHVFWDQETWMYPAIMPFHPKLAQHMSDYRFYALYKAIEKAKMNGWKGAQYPWESAFTGVETSPWAPSANNEQHVIGDISFAISQFLWLKQSTNKQWFVQKGRKIIEEIARFWASRLFYNQSLDHYEIHNVMPPDEYVHCANNSVFTNYVAAFSLRAPLQLSKYFNEPADPDYATWATKADKVFIPISNTTEGEYHPETDSYKIGTAVKQADVILLGYPMQLLMPVWLRKNDLDIYEKVTDPDGPAMTWSMFAVGRLDLQQSTQAWETFQRSYDYVRDPFKIWTEVRNGDGAVNFMTGMGGFLQSITNGYVGLRIFPDSLRFMPVLPPTASNITLHGLKYKGVSLDVILKRMPDVIEFKVISSDEPMILTLRTTSGQTNSFTSEISLPWQELLLTITPVIKLT